jgi:beta-sarcoglycan
MEIVWSADQDLFLRSVNGTIILAGQQGVALDVQGMPLTLGGPGSTPQYKLCVCRSKGRLFRVRLPDTCLGFPGRPDPCAT